MAAPASIFARIVAGEIPCQCVYQDQYVFAFLDVNPLSDGHTLIVTKRTVERVEDLTVDEGAALGRVLPLLVRRLTAVTGAEGCNILQNNGRVAGQEVPHVHFHIIPRRADDGLGYRWRAQKRSPAELETLAQRIRAQA